MKRVLFIMLFSSWLLANPIAVYILQFNEFGFDENGDWWLELRSDYSDQFSPELYDSLIISSSAGSAKADTIRSVDENGLVVLTLQNLLSPVTFQPGNDYIAVTLFLEDYTQSDTIHYNCGYISSEGAYSVAAIRGYPYVGPPYGDHEYFYYAADKSPTKGVANDTTGTCGTLTGILYDNENHPLSGYQFMALNYYPIDLDEEGRYRLRVLAYETQEKYIRQKVNNLYIYDQHIETIEYNMYPDSVTVQDIHLISDVYTGIDAKEISIPSRIDIKTYPNPFNSDVTFTVDIAGDQLLEQAFIVIYNLQGQKIKSLPLGSANHVRWDGRDILNQLQSSGVYLYRLETSREILNTGSVLLLK